MVCCKGRPDDGQVFGYSSPTAHSYLRNQCATKNLIIHVEWTEPKTQFTAEPSSPITPSTPLTGRLALTSPVVSSRRPSSAAYGRMTTPLKSSGQANGAGRPSLSTRTSSIKAPRDLDAMAVKPRIIAVLETPDVSVGAVDPRKRRVATSTRFSSRLGADRRVNDFSGLILFDKSLNVIVRSLCRRLPIAVG